jgi:hypothetical protein
MAEKPLNIPAWKSRALLAGATMLRVPVKEQPACPEPESDWYPDSYNHTNSWCFFGKRDTEVHNKVALPMWKAPFSVGDVIWGRETFMFSKGADERERYIGTDMEPMLGPKPWYWYRATEPDAANDSAGKSMFKWRPAQQMPRHASRHLLTVKAVRCERLKDASENDFILEGCPDEYLQGKNWFQPLWDATYPKHPWDSNCWTWVYTVERKAA